MSIFSLFKKKKQEDFVYTKTKKDKNQQKQLKTGIVFSGGGVRGFAYIGVLKAFKEAGIDFDIVAGTSIGSFIGAAYAAGIDIEEMEKIALKTKQSDFTSSKVFFVPSKTERLEKLISNTIKIDKFEELKKPLVVVAVDLKTGQEIHLTKGNLTKAIAGSCAIPGVFCPVEFENTMVVDGGLTNNMPAGALREMGADIVISLDINPTRGYGTESSKLMEVLKASLRILMVSNVVNGYVYSDYVLKIDLSDFSQLKIGNTKAMIEKGYQVAKQAVPEILEILRSGQVDSSIKKVSRRLKLIQKRQQQIDKLTQKLSEEEKKELDKVVKDSRKQKI